MSDELKPCPFCGEMPPVFEKEQCAPIVGHACRILDLQITVPLHTWNARAERTCRIDGVRGGGNCGTTTYRLSCGHAAVMPDGIRFRHSPECGAKVVDMVGVEEAPC